MKLSVLAGMALIAALLPWSALAVEPPQYGTQRLQDGDIDFPLTPQQ